GRIERVAVGDEIGRHALLDGDLLEPVRVGTVRRADHKHDIDAHRHFAHRALAVLRRVADVFRVRPDDGRKARAQRVDHRLGVVDAERRLRDIGKLLRIADLQAGDLFGLRDQINFAINAAHRAFDLGMAGMADQHDLAPLIGVALALAMDLGDQRAGGVDHRQVARFGLVLDGAGYAVGAENRHAAGRDFSELVDEMRALGAQSLDHMPVMDDLVPDIDRGSVFLECALDDFDRALDAGAKPSWLGQNDPHFKPLYRAGRPPPRGPCCDALY